MWDFGAALTQGGPGSKKGLFLAQKLETITENAENLKKMVTTKPKNHPAFHRRGFNACSVDSMSDRQKYVSISPI